MSIPNRISRREFLKLTGFTAAAALLASCTPQNARYIYPLNHAVNVSPKATMIVRYGPTLNSQAANSLVFTVNGSKSGSHPGQIFLADDQQTVIFKPSTPFTPGEQVSYDVSSYHMSLGTSYTPIHGSFTVAVNMQPGSPVSAPSSPLPTLSANAFPNYLTLPQDIPHYNLQKTSDLAQEGYIFVAPFYWTKSVVGSYLLILDKNGEIVYYKSMADAYAAFDFKVLSNGLLSYFDQKTAVYNLMDSHYEVVKQYTAGNGYTADLHDFLVLPDGSIMLLIYDNETVDMSKVVKGGKPDATVTGLVIQKIDPSMNVVWEWRSWDHFSFFDSTVDLTAQTIDLIHGNGLALASDGNLLLSSRNLCEITKINMQTGEIIWRLGGKANQFTFVNDELFAYQHNIAQLENGDITIFDNHGTQQNPAPSRSLQYRVDETNKTVTKVWSYINTPPVFGTYMGDTQRLPNGNTFIGWGAAYNGTGYAYVSMTEVDPSDNVLFEIDFDQPYVSYRAFHTSWQGFPDSQPALAYKKDSNGITLGYSWNGATEVAAWQLFGGNEPAELGMIAQGEKTGFENQYHLVTLSQGSNFYQVAALDKNGKVLGQSKIISIT